MIGYNDANVKLAYGFDRFDELPAIRALEIFNNQAFARHFEKPRDPYARKGGRASLRPLTTTERTDNPRSTQTATGGISQGEPTMSEQQTDQQEYASFNDRMLKNHGPLLGAAMRVALALQAKKTVPAEQRGVVDTVLKKYHQDDDERKSCGEDQLWPSTQGDLMSLCLSGMLRKPDANVRDLLLQIDDEKSGAQALFARNRGKKLEDWPKKDAEQLLILEAKKDEVIDPVDLGHQVALVIFGRNIGNQVKAFAHLRRQAGITRSCFYRDGAPGEERITRDFIFMRRTQQSVRALLGMVGASATETQTEETQTEEFDELLGALNEAAAKDRKRVMGGTDEWAIDILESWLEGKTSRREEEDPEKIEALETLRKEIEKTKDAIAINNADLKATRNVAAREAIQADNIRLERELAEREAKLKELQGGVNLSGVLDATKPTGKEPMPGNTPRVETDKGGSGEETPETETVEALEAKIAKDTAELTLINAAIARHQHDAEALYTEADTLRQEGKRVEAGKKDVDGGEAEERRNGAQEAAALVQKRIEQNMAKVVALKAAAEKATTPQAEPAQGSPRKKKDRRKANKTTETVVQPQGSTNGGTTTTPADGKTTPAGDVKPKDLKGFITTLKASTLTDEEKTSLRARAAGGDLVGAVEAFDLLVED